MMKKLKGGLAATLAFALVMVAGPAAAGDWTAVTGAIDFSGEITAIQAIVGIIATVIVVLSGAAWIFSALKRK